MLAGIANIRGIAQGFLRQAVGLGMKVTEAYYALKSVGLSYLSRDFRVDFEKYEEQDFITSEISLLDPNYLIPQTLHVESTWSLTAKYKYDLEGVYIDAKGKEQITHWSVIDDRRLTQKEIADQGALFAQEYTPEGFELEGDIALIGSWTMSQVGFA